jgi:hypothetical protein
MMTGRRHDVPPGDAPWRVFLSHTSELRQHPARRSFVAAAEAAVVRAGHAVTDMAYFAPRESTCVDHCAGMVARSDVYVGVIGVRYGSPAPCLPERSYTELEFDVASSVRLPRLIFLIHEDAPALPPAERSERQEAFRARLLASGLLVARVRWPAELELGLLHALGELRVLVHARRQSTLGPWRTRFSTQLERSWRCASTTTVRSQTTSSIASSRRPT